MSERFIVGVELTSHCNLRCRHCLRQRPRQVGSINVELFERVLDEARIYGEPHIALTGGEPTLHPRLFEILRAIERRGYRAHMVTNGTTLPQIIKRLEPLRQTLPLLCFSLDGATEATHDAVRGAGTFRQAVLAMSLARYKGFRVTVQMAVNRLNRHELDQMPGLCERLGVNTLFVAHTQPTPDAHAFDLLLSPQEWLEVERQAKCLAERGSGVPPQLSVGRWSTGSLAPCHTLSHKSINIDSRGRLTFCCQLSGLSDPPNQRDVIADLNDTTLCEGHQQLLGMVDTVVRERLAMAASMASGSKHQATPFGFQCWHCMTRFGKVAWLQRDPENPWLADPPSADVNLERAQPHQRNRGTA